MMKIILTDEQRGLLKKMLNSRIRMTENFIKASKNVKFREQMQRDLAAFSDLAETIEQDK